MELLIVSFGEKAVAIVTSLCYYMIMQRYITAVKDVLQGKPFSLRSSKWFEVRDLFVKSNPTCAACGGNIKLQVHHMQPFHLHPELELDSTNLITLCESGTKCHLEIGHLGNWKNFNPNVVQDAAKTLCS